MKSFIVTADDYGMCTIVDKAIDDCIQAGLLTSTNVIVNMEDMEAARDLRQRFPTVSIGLHWNVTAGKPISEINKVSSLINPQTGEFWKVPQFTLRFKNGMISKDELKRELVAQYEVFCSLCGRPDYWNTHQNSALSLYTYSFFNHVALELGINKTRSFRRVYIKDKGLGVKDAVKEFIKKIALDIWFGKVIPKTGTRMPDGRMIYFNSSDKTNDMKNIGENVEWGKKNIVELVIHPAISSEHPSFGTITTERVAEWKLFTNPSTKDYFDSLGIQLTTFNKI